MHSRRTSPPTSSESLPDYRPPNPGDETQNFISRLRSGDDSDLLTEEDEEDVAADDAALQHLRSTKEEEGRWPERRPEVITAPTTPAMPPALAKLIGTDAEDELMAVARFLDVRNKKKLTLVFHTPIGDVKCPVNWSSTESSQLHRSKHLLLILVRSSESMFVPRPGSELEISFLEHRDQPRLRVLCLAPPMQLYPGVGVDLLCFLPQTESVEKQGVLHDGAPSVVSGRPSDIVDAETGEPVISGEKSASVRISGDTGEGPVSRGFAPLEASPSSSSSSEDFDVTRGS